MPWRITFAKRGCTRKWLVASGQWPETIKPSHKSVLKGLGFTRCGGPKNWLRPRWFCIRGVTLVMPKDVEKTSGLLAPEGFQF